MSSRRKLKSAKRAKTASPQASERPKKPGTQFSYTARLFVSALVLLLIGAGLRIWFFDQPSHVLSRTKRPDSTGSIKLDSISLQNSTREELESMLSLPAPEENAMALAESDLRSPRETR